MMRCVVDRTGAGRARGSEDGEQNNRQSMEPAPSERSESKEPALSERSESKGHAYGYSSRDAIASAMRRRAAIVFAGGTFRILRNPASAVR